MADKYVRIGQPEAPADCTEPIKKFVDMGDYYAEEVYSSGGGGGGAVTVANGADVALGATTDAAITTDAVGTVSGKLRGLVAHFVTLLSRFPASLGQKAMAASLPVVLASDQTVIPISDNSGTITVDGTVTVQDGGGAITVDGSVTVADGGGALTVDGTVTATVAPLVGPGAPTVDSYTSKAIDLAASTANQALVAAPGANKQIWVYGLFMMADTAAGTVVLQDEDDTALSGTMAVSDEGGWVLPMSGNFAMPWIKVATNKALEADTGACTVDGILTYGVVSV